jgi:nucleotide-binding universal stress UspA family protein
LVASDLTDRSRYPLMRAVELQRENAARLTVLHVISPNSAQHRASHRQAALVALTAHLSEAAPDEPRRVAVEALMGEPVRTIVGEAEARDVDLIVLGAPAQLEVDAKLGKRASSFAGFDGS